MAKKKQTQGAVTVAKEVHQNSLNESDINRRSSRLKCKKKVTYTNNEITIKEHENPSSDEDNVPIGNLRQHKQIPNATGTIRVGLSTRNAKKATKKELQSTKEDKLLVLSEPQEIIEQIETAPEGEHDSEAEGKSCTTIDALIDKHKIWTFKGVVLRKGTIDPFRSGNGKLFRLIFMDDMGTKINAVVFTEATENLYGQFNKGNTYYVSNGTVTPVKSGYPTANDKIELILDKRTEVKEAKIKVSMDNYKFDPVHFRDVNNYSGNDHIDIYGEVLKVDQLKFINKANGSGLVPKREITLRNKESDTILLTLWGDMAINEGAELENIANQVTALAASSLKMSTYDGLISVGITAASTIWINPILSNTLIPTKRSTVNGENSKIEARSIIPNPSVVKNVKIKDLMQDQPTNLKGSRHSFEAKVIDVRNLVNPWYDACRKCNKMVTITDGVPECTKCGKNIEHYLRYNLRLTLSDGETTIVATLFDAAKKIIGHEPGKFANAANKRKKQEELDEILMRTYDKNAVFSTYVTGNNLEARKKGNFVVDDIQIDENDSEVEEDDEDSEVEEEDEDSEEEEDEDSEVEEDDEDSEVEEDDEDSEVEEDDEDSEVEVTGTSDSKPIKFKKVKVEKE